MRHWIPLLGLAVVLLATACRTGTSPTKQPGSSTAVSTPTVPSASPTAAPSPGLPTPDASGQYHNLTFAQAQQLAPFHLVEPTWVPTYLHDEQISASLTNITQVRSSTPAASATPPTGPVQVVSISFLGPWPEPPAVIINELKQGTPLGRDWDPRSITGTTTITIAGHMVTRTTRAIPAIYPPPGPNAEYVWTDQGTTFQLLAITPAPANEQDVEHIIAAMLGQGDASSPSTLDVADAPFEMLDRPSVVLRHRSSQR